MLPLQGGYISHSMLFSPPDIIFCKMKTVTLTYLPGGLPDHSSYELGREQSQPMATDNS